MNSLPSSPEKRGRRRGRGRGGLGASQSPSKHQRYTPYTPQGSPSARRGPMESSSQIPSPMRFGGQRGNASASFLDRERLEYDAELGKLREENAGLKEANDELRAANRVLLANHSEAVACLVSTWKKQLCSTPSVEPSLNAVIASQQDLRTELEALKDATAQGPGDAERESAYWKARAIVAEVRLQQIQALELEKQEREDGEIKEFLASL